MAGRLAILGVLVLALSACANVAVRSERTEGIDVSAYRTWNWLPREDWEGPAISDPDPRARRAFREAVEGAMKANGYDRKSSKPGFLLMFRVEETTVSGSGFRGTGQSGYLWRRGSTGVTTSSYEECLLTMEFRDAASGRLAWRGVARCSNPEEGASGLTALLDNLLADAKK